MITMFILACTLYKTDDCRMHELTFVEEGLTPMACMLGSQPVIAKWAEGHPNVYVKKWTCHYKNRDEADM